MHTFTALKHYQMPTYNFWLINLFLFIFLNFSSLINSFNPLNHPLNHSSIDPSSHLSMKFSKLLLICCYCFATAQSQKLLETHLFSIHYLFSVKRCLCNRRLQRQCSGAKLDKKNNNKMFIFTNIKNFFFVIIVKRKTKRGW